MHRPDCMKTSFVHPDVQCPKKPRGRKKKGDAVSSSAAGAASSSCPKAAACELSADMEETDAKPGGTTRAKRPRKSREDKDKDIAPKVPAKRFKKNKDAGETDDTVVGNDEQEVDKTAKTKSRRGKKRAPAPEHGTEDGSDPPSAPAETPTETAEEETEKEKKKKLGKEKNARKSKAYRRAVAEAKRNGATEEDAKSAGRRVPWFNLSTS